MVFLQWLGDNWVTLHRKERERMKTREKLKA